MQMLVIERFWPRELHRQGNQLPAQTGRIIVENRTSRSHTISLQGKGPTAERRAPSLSLIRSGMALTAL